MREEACLTQEEVAEYLQISVRSYRSYENDENKKETPKYRYIFNELEKLTRIDEKTGILSREKIIEKSANIFSKYGITYCYLFGSYAKGVAREDSDIDLLISDDVTGLHFYSLIEELRTALKKKIDILDLNQIVDNKELINEILKNGIKIYEQN